MELRPFEPDTDNAGVGSDKNFCKRHRVSVSFIFYFIGKFSFLNL